MDLAFLDLDIAGFEIDLLPVEADNLRCPDPGESAKGQVWENVIPGAIQQTAHLVCPEYGYLSVRQLVCKACASKLSRHF